MTAQLAEEEPVALFLSGDESIKGQEHRLLAALQMKRTYLLVGQKGNPIFHVETKRNVRS